MCVRNVYEQQDVLVQNEYFYSHNDIFVLLLQTATSYERWGAGVETQKNVRGEVGGWGRVPFNEPYAPSLSTIYDGA